MIILDCAGALPVCQHVRRTVVVKNDQINTSAWEQRKLGEVVDQYRELVPTPQNGYVRMGVRSHAKGTFLTPVHPGEQIEESKLSRVAPDNLVVNIVFAWEHAVAITGLQDSEALVSHRFPQFSFHKDMSPEFFKFIILDDRFRHHLWLASPSGAGRNKTLNVSTMLEYGFVVPRKAEQELIGSFFSRLDSLITLHQRKQSRWSRLH
ncbi:restriction endonuclease subunit S [Bifidobacterium sp. 82T24]|uniref:restriction endonuclease subunit S n=1 Tax=Bifidobacterium pluvialisilvae TaxID=2834436 RepID=UPI001C5A2E16|nr:restriction endonuclease subunit S [Bifidobacterium pluvialisilvae]MBW3087238.1 restriction endonuclease subunit S [Bifidobacterium pluvialisilvae]